jgi:hypothetical protein
MAVLQQGMDERIEISVLLLRGRFANIWTGESDVISMFLF